MYSTSETVALNLKYRAKDELSGGLNSARRALGKFGQFARGVQEKVAAGFRRMWELATGPVGMMVGAAGLGGGIYSVFEYLKRSVSTAGEWEGYLAKLTVALKDATKAEQAFAWAKKFAATTPFEMGEVVDATTRLEMYGLTAKKWLPLVGDMAGAMGRSIVDAVEAVADAVSGGGLERLKEFGITSTQLLKAGAKGSAMGGVSYIGDEAIAKLKQALVSIMSSRYGGGMSKMMVTWEGKLSNLKDAFSQIRGRIGEGMLPALKRIVGVTTEWVNKIVKSGMAEYIGSKLGRAIEFVFNKVKSVVNWTLDNWPKIKETALGVWEAVKSKVQEVIDKAKEWFTTTKDSTGNLDQATNSLNSMAVAATSIAQSLKMWGESLKDVELTSAKLKQHWQASRALGWGIAEALAYQNEIIMKIARWATPLGLLPSVKESTKKATEDRKYASTRREESYTDYLASTEDVAIKTQQAEQRITERMATKATQQVTAPQTQQTKAEQPSDTGGYFTTPIYSPYQKRNRETGALENQVQGWTYPRYFAPGMQTPQDAVSVNIQNWTGASGPMMQASRGRMAQPAF